MSWFLRKNHLNGFYAMGKYSIEDIRKTAFKHLHLIFIKKNESIGTYRVVDSEKEGTPKIVDYISFHYNSIKLQVKDIGSNIIYLVDPKRYNNSRIETLLRKNPELEKKIRSWYPFLWGEGTPDDEATYSSIMRQLEGLLELEKPFFEKIYKNNGGRINE
jgi:hypothetical protein